jgi:phage terminase small subunit
MVARRTSAQEAARKRTDEIEAKRWQVQRAVLALDEPQPAPDHLGDASTPVWEAFMTERYRTISPGEVHLLVRYCETLDRRAMLQAETLTKGYSVPGSRPGMTVQAPWSLALQSVEVELRQQERVLSIGPSHRAKQSIAILTAEEQIRRLNELEPKSKPVRGSASVSGGSDDPRHKALKAGEA